MKSILLCIQSGKGLLFLLPGLLLIFNQGLAQSLSVNDIGLTDVTTKKVINLSDFRNKKAIVVIFMCNGCPYSKYYKERIISLTKQYTSAGFILINSSPDKFAKEESMENMAEFVKNNGIDVPYLADKGQEALQAFNAKKCPEAFVLKPSGGNFLIQYQGAIDDNPQVEKDVKSFYLSDAIKSVLSGESPSNLYVRPNGCMIKRN